MKLSVYFFSVDEREKVPCADRYDFVLQTAKRLDRAGFHAILTPERHFQEFGGSFPNPSLLAMAIAAVTETIKIRSGSVVVPLHHPLRIAEEWAVVDQLSRGRAELTYATGWHRADFVFNPESYAKRRQITFENIRLIERLWKGELASFVGPDGAAVEVKTFPATFRAGTALPGWLVYSSSPQTWIKAGELGLGVLTLLDNTELLKSNIMVYKKALASAGHPPETARVTVALHTLIADDDAWVKATVEEAMKHYLRAFLAQKKSDEQLNKDRRVKAMTEAEKEVILNLTFRDLYDNRSLLGTPAKCDKIARQLEEIGVTELACMIDFGLDFDTVAAALPALISFKRKICGEGQNRTKDEFLRSYFSLARESSAGESAVHL